MYKWTNAQLFNEEEITKTRSAREMKGDIYGSEHKYEVIKKWKTPRKRIFRIIYNVLLLHFLLGGKS